jgi:DNA-binding FadR family transcriptional regulator
MFSGRPDEHFIRDLFELRGIIEPTAAALAAQRHTPEQLDAMAQALSDMATHGLATSAGQDADRKFHRLILAATGNEALASLASSVGAAVQWTTRYKQRASQTPRDPLPEHAAVHAAIAAADPPGASAAMAELLRLALADMT